MRTRRERADERGIALIMTLLVLSILIVMITQFSWSAKVERTIARNAKDDMKMNFAARGAIAYAEAYLRADRALQTNVDSAREDWADPTKFQSVRVGDVSLRVELADCERFLNINLLQDAASKDWATTVLYNLADHLQIDGAKELVDKIVEFVSGTPSNVQFTPTTTTEAGKGATANMTPHALAATPALAAGAPGQPTGRTSPLTFPDELIGIPGLSAQQIQGLLGVPANGQDPEKPGLLEFLTTRGSKKININTVGSDAAPRDALLWALLPATDSGGQPLDRDAAVQAIVAFRTGADTTGTTGTTGATGTTGKTGTTKPATPATAASTTQQTDGQKPGQDFKKVDDLTQVQGLAKVFAAQGGGAGAGGGPGSSAAAAAAGGAGAQAQRPSLRKYLTVEAEDFRLLVDADRAGMHKRYEIVIKRGKEEFSTLLWHEVQR